MSERFQKRSYETAASQLLTPHPSSSTQYLLSSPSRAVKKVWPDIQYARPNLQGDWYSIGRASTLNDLTLPSCNRLISRVHIRLRYLQEPSAFEVDCIGFNGAHVQVASENHCYLKKSTKATFPLPIRGGLLLNVVGSRVEVVQPEGSTEPNERLLAPSSPVGYMAEMSNRACTNSESPVYTHQSMLEDFQALSPLPNSTGMVTPSVTPSPKRIRLSHANQQITPAPEDLEIEDVSRHSAILQPRLINFQESIVPYKESAAGKENVPPMHPTSFNSIKSPLPRRPTVVNQCEIDATRMQSGQQCNGKIESGSSLHESVLIRPVPQAGSLITSDCSQTHSVKEAPEPPSSESPLHQMNTIHDGNGLKPEPEEKQRISGIDDTIGQCSDEAFDPEELDPDFVELLLNVLASCATSPAPSSLLLPFFPPDTEITTVEAILRTQSCVTEHSAKHKSTTEELATWSYEPGLDTDSDRVRRLTFLQKPPRSLRPRTYQQLHTYEYEHAKYVMDCEAAGIKPVRFDGTRYRKTRNTDS